MSTALVVRCLNFVDWFMCVCILHFFAIIACIQVCNLQARVKGERDYVYVRMRTNVMRVAVTGGEIRGVCVFGIKTTQCRAENLCRETTSSTRGGQRCYIGAR